MNKKVSELWWVRQILWNLRRGLNNFGDPCFFSSFENFLDDHWESMFPKERVQVQWKRWSGNIFYQTKVSQVSFLGVGCLEMRNKITLAFCFIHSWCFRHSEFIWFHVDICWRSFRSAVYCPLYLLLYRVPLCFCVTWLARLCILL